MMMNKSATIKDNVDRILRHYNLTESVSITQEDEDRVWGWPPSDELRDFLVTNKWTKELSAITAKFHGDGESYREPGAVMPALQVVLHPAYEPWKTWEYFFEMDFDYANPLGGDLASLIVHLGEVLGHAITGGMTDQQKVSKLLDKRGVA